NDLMFNFQTHRQFGSFHLIPRKQKSVSAEIEYVTSTELQRHKPRLEGCHIVGCCACSFTPFLWCQSEGEYEQWVRHLPRFAGQGPMVTFNADDKAMLKAL